jgi:hypothetical protein
VPLRGRSILQMLILSPRLIARKDGKSSQWKLDFRESNSANTESFSPKMLRQSHRFVYLRTS